jgi:hypothetical protein
VISRIDSVVEILDSVYGDPYIAAPAPRDNQTFSALIISQNGEKCLLFRLKIWPE